MIINAKLIGKKQGEKKMKTEIEKLMEPIIVRTGWISNGPGSAELAGKSPVFQIKESDVPKNGLEFLLENRWWREESDDGVIQRCYWVR
jgi:hypothetical protein